MQTASFIRKNGEYHPFPLCEILYIKAKNNYCEVYTSAKKKYFAYITLGSLEKKLPENLFCRTHRSYIVAIPFISRFKSTQICIGDSILPLSKAGYKELRKRTIIFASDAEREIQVQGAKGIVKTMNKKEKNFKKKTG